jgi:hypothetical protein
MQYTFVQDVRKIPAAVKRCPDHLLAEIILLDRPSEGEKKCYGEDEYNFYNALYLAAIEELHRRQAQQMVA